MDHEDNPQAKTNQEGGDMAKQPTDLMLIGLPTDLAKPTGLDVTIKESQSQARPSINMESRQEQEESRRNISAILKQNSRLFHNSRTTEPTKYGSAWQPTLRIMERPTWYMYEHGTSRHGISRHGRLHQDSEASQWVLTEATRPTPRSLVRLTFENG